MYKTAIAAFTMTAAALLLAAAPAVANDHHDDWRGPNSLDHESEEPYFGKQYEKHEKKCEGEFGMLQLRAPLKVFWGDGDCTAGVRRLLREEDDYRD